MVNKISNSGAAIIIQVFTLFIQVDAKNLAFLCPFSKVFTLYNSR